MSTRSTIAILNTDGSVQSVYAQFDGYLSNNGIILYEHYKDISKVRQLIDLGSVCSLKEALFPPAGVSHTLDKAHPGVTTFFGRDGSDDHSFSSSFVSLEEYLKNGDFQQYDYLFNEKKNQWYLLNTKNGKLKKLETAILNDSDVKDSFKQMINSTKLSKKLEKELAVKNTVDRKNKI